MIHETLNHPTGAVDVFSVRGNYKYYHYKCDGVDDRGWGCGYRTLQTLCSWVRENKSSGDQKLSPVPSIRDIQSALVTMEDKPSSFLDSHDWIGSVECALVVDYLYDVPCKIIHVSSGNALIQYVSEITDHFREKGSPVMMGGDSDAASKGIMGIAKTHHNYSLLVLDPHYVGPEPDGSMLQEEKMLRWRPLDSFYSNSFYNLCLPQLVSTPS